ncbi:hypothetical protein ES703_57302 [subsurface metagenome]
MEASVKELRSSTKRILSAVRRGDTVIITYRGKPFAKISPIEDSKLQESEQTNDSLFGMWKDNAAVGDVDDYINKVRKGRFA